MHQPLTGHGTLTARVTSLTSQAMPGVSTGTALGPWAKAGIIVTDGTRPGSAYAAMLVTADHGVRMQYDYTGDIAGLPGAVSAASPRWLRLTRLGDTLTGYESTDGTHWTTVGTVHLPGLPATVQAGLFTTAPGGGSAGGASGSLTGNSNSGGESLATAAFDHVSLGASHPAAPWAGHAVGGAAHGQGFHQAGDRFTVTGTGDIAPDVAASASGAGGTPVERTLTGTFAGLIAVLVVAVMFMTAEYRRNLITVTLTATPGRGRVLAAKAVVIGAAMFAAGLIGSAAAMPIGEALLRSNGNFILPVSLLTEIRVVVGNAAMLAIAAVLAVGLGTLLRHSAGAVTAVIVGIVLPYFFATDLPVLPATAGDWLLRVTPAAGFAVQQTVIQYPQVAAGYSPQNGYYPFAPWLGFAILCVYAAAVMALAAFRLRRADA